MEKKTKEELKIELKHLMYKRKEKKFNISPSLIEYCLYREDMAEIKYILESLKKK